MIAVAALATHGALAHDIAIRDDAGRQVRLAGPAQRIVTVAPHATELVFAAGGGTHLVATDRYSDYPAQALNLPRVGDGLNLNLERVLALKPDLLVLWAYGDGPAHTGTLPMALLDKLGVAVYYSNPQKLADIPEAISRLGQIMGTQTVADAKARELRQTLAALRARYAGQRPLRTFYQLGGSPMYTLNGKSIVNDALAVCGATNVFANLPVTAPMVGVESVLLANPQVIVTAATASAGTPIRDAWRAYAPGLAAAALGNLLGVDADRMNRPGPRMIEATRSLCEDIEKARLRTP